MFAAADDLMTLDAAGLRTQAGKLLATLAAKDQEIKRRAGDIAFKQARIDKLTHEIALLRRFRFGQRAEQLPAGVQLLHTLVQRLPHQAVAGRHEPVGIQATPWHRSLTRPRKRPYPLVYQNSTGVDNRGLGRADRSAVLAYLPRLSGTTSRAQLTRLVSRWMAGKRPVKLYRAPAHAFARRYTAADVALRA